MLFLWFLSSNSIFYSNIYFFILIKNPARCSYWIFCLGLCWITACLVCRFQTLVSCPRDSRDRTSHQRCPRPRCRLVRPDRNLPVHPCCRMRWVGHRESVRFLQWPARLYVLRPEARRLRAGSLIWRSWRRAACRRRGSWSGHGDDRSFPGTHKCLRRRGSSPLPSSSSFGRSFQARRSLQGCCQSRGRSRLLWFSGTDGHPSKAGNLLGVPSYESWCLRYDQDPIPESCWVVRRRVWWSVASPTVLGWPASQSVLSVLVFFIAYPLRDCRWSSWVLQSALSELLPFLAYPLEDCWWSPWVPQSALFELFFFLAYPLRDCWWSLWVLQCALSFVVRSFFLRIGLVVFFFLLYILYIFY